RIDGQVGIGHAKEPIERVFIEPPDVRANPEALERILEADMVVIGPGSLYSSVLPNLLISDIRDALAAAPGMRVYGCNAATPPRPWSDSSRRTASSGRASVACAAQPHRLPEPRHARRQRGEGRARPNRSGAPLLPACRAGRPAFHRSHGWRREHVRVRHGPHRGPAGRIA